MAADRLQEVCSALAGIWLGVKAAWWSEWLPQRQRAALALGSTAPFSPRHAGLRDQALVDPALASLWAWHELRLLLRHALPVLEQRLQREWRQTGAVDTSQVLHGGDGDRVPTPAELSRTRRQWLAAVRGL
jgi:hypothetical protein